MKKSSSPKKKAASGKSTALRRTGKTALRANSHRKAAKRKSEEKSEGGGRSLWSGSLSFGLLNIPVTLGSAKEEADLHFQMLDSRDFGHIGYRQYNKSTGKEVPKDKITKGYEYENGKFVLVTDEDFKRANPRAVSSIDLEDFVELKDLDPMLFESPYYLRPGKNGEKGYRLLRDVMLRTNKVAVGKVVLFRKQRLVAVIPRGDFLILEVLRFDREILTVDEVEGLDARLSKVKISPREIEMAEALVAGMTSKWNARKYEDTYHEDLLRMIKLKAKKGTITAQDIPEVREAPESGGKIVDLMPLLRRSLEAGKKQREKRT